MALAVTKPKPPGIIPVHGQKSYAAAARPHFTTTSQSLILGEVVTNSIGKPTTTRIWRNARIEDSYFLDISKIANVTAQQHLQLLD